MLAARHHTSLGHSKNEHRDFSSDMSKRGSVLAGADNKGRCLMEKNAGSFTNAPSATETIHSRLVVNHNSLSCNFQLYMLGHSPICVNEVEKSLENYPYKVIACELITGLKFGFPLNYSGPRSPITSKNLKSVADMPELTKQKISKEIAMGRIAGPFSAPPFPTLRVSPIGLVPKKNGDFLMIHNLSYPCNNSVNDFIDHEFCSVRYSSIDDAVKIIQRLGRGTKLSKCDIKSAFRLHRIFPGDFDQLGFVFQDKYYFDKCLPFGASISCALFEKFSSALH